MPPNKAMKLTGRRSQVCIVRGRRPAGRGFTGGRQLIADPLCGQKRRRKRTPFAAHPPSASRPCSSVPPSAEALAFSARLHGFGPGTLGSVRPPFWFGPFGHTFSSLGASGARFVQGRVRAFGQVFAWARGLGARQAPHAPRSQHGMSPFTPSRALAFAKCAARLTTPSPSWLGRLPVQSGRRGAARWPHNKRLQLTAAGGGVPSGQPSGGRSGGRLAPALRSVVRWCTRGCS